MLYFSALILRGVSTMRGREYPEIYPGFGICMALRKNARGMKITLASHDRWSYTGWARAIKSGKGRIREMSKRNLIKLASAEGRTFALGQIVVERPCDPAFRADWHGETGVIEGFVRSVSGGLIVAKIRVGKRLCRAFLQDINPAPDDIAARDRASR